MTLEEKRIKTLHKLDSLHKLGSIPKIIFDVSQLIKSDPGNSYKLASTISKDQGLTTKVLSIANSPMYGLPRKVSSLEFAIMLMGTEEIHQMVTAISLSDSFKFRSTGRFNFMEYWKHSMLVGTASKDIARRLGFGDLSGEAFLAGMLHDIGMQIIATTFPDEFDSILKSVGSDLIFLKAEREILGLTHQEIGKYLIQKWKLPENLADVIEFHHTPSQSEKNSVLASIVHMADSMTQEFKIGQMNWDNDITFDLGIIEILGIGSAEKAVSFIADYKDIFVDAAATIKL
ncbi:MAG: HDOD domain-containing protein [Ignavibacteriales bacterium]|nr:HDOD domain-containing protein [Ignavibacteriales bacterium]